MLALLFAKEELELLRPKDEEGLELLRPEEELPGDPHDSMMSAASATAAASERRFIRLYPGSNSA